LSKDFLLRRIIVAIGTKRTCRDDPLLVRFRGEADMDRGVASSASVANDPKRTWRGRNSVFTQGDPADSVFYIREGRVKIAVLSGQGKEAVVALLKAGDFIGEGCLTSRPRRVSTARAVEDSEITRVDKRTMVRMLRDEPNFSERFMAHLLARTIRVEEDLVDQLFNSSEKRLARALLLLANFGKDGRQEPVIAEVSQETLADMIGTTRSRVSHFMNKFRKLGYIDYNGDLEVHSSLLDAVLHEKPQIKMPK
jgi:CRP/FNR family transcriptional regulator, cyclic AMP receptor protein